MQNPRAIARYLLAVYFLLMGHMMFAHHHYQGCAHDDGHEYFGDSCGHHDSHDHQKHHHHHHGEDEHHQNSEHTSDEESNWLQSLGDFFHIHFCTGDSETFVSTDSKPDVKPLTFESNFLFASPMELSFTVDDSSIEQLYIDRWPHAPPLRLSPLRGPPLA